MPDDTHQTAGSGHSPVVSHLNELANALPPQHGVGDAMSDGLGITGHEKEHELEHLRISSDDGDGPKVEPVEILDGRSPTVPSASVLSDSTYVDSTPASPWYQRSGRSAKRPYISSAEPIEMSSRAPSQGRLQRQDSNSFLLSANGTTPKRTFTQLKQQYRLTWISISTIILAVISTCLSGLFLAVAFYAPRYGRTVSAQGNLSASTAAFLTTLLARLIEITFITSMLAVLGQELSRRAYGKSKWKGVSLSEISMRSWIVQPGTLISRYESVRYAGLSLLGLASLLAALVAVLYAPAATALVQPQLKLTEWRDRILQVPVKTSFANPVYLQENCKTPITPGYDKLYSGVSCETIVQAANAYHNLATFLAQWYSFENATSLTQDQRPNGTALIFENVIVNGSWIERTDMVKAHEQNGFVIDNVTLAAPHTAVAQAAHFANNDIIQPSDLDGLGSYEIHAGVPSPALNVLCVTASKDELAPLVYEFWPNTTTPVNMTLYPDVVAKIHEFNNATFMDDIFEWGPKYGMSGLRPMFPKLPMDYNTIGNFTAPYGRDSIYLLGKGGSLDVTNSSDFGTDKDYSLCRLRVRHNPHCSTRYSAAASTNVLFSHCEDPLDVMTYDAFRPRDAVSNASNSGILDWPNVADTWGTAVALNQGIFDANASISRVLTELILRKPAMLPNLPTFAEAVAVLAIDTILTSTVDAPVVDFWNLTAQPPNILDPASLQLFNTKVRLYEYASGGTYAYHRAFFPVLFITFLLNVLALAYFASHRTWLVDLTEPPTLFGLAVSPPAGNEGTSYVPEEEVENRRAFSTTAYSRDYSTPWSVREDTGGVTIEKANADGQPTSPIVGLKNRLGSRLGRTRAQMQKVGDRRSFQVVKEEPHES